MRNGFSISTQLTLWLSRGTPSEKINGEIRLKCDPLNFNALKIFSISCLNLDFVAFSMLVKKA
jgi:hypothetical protein